MKLWSHAKKTGSSEPAPYGVSERGFHKKNCFVDIATILNHHASTIFDVGAYNGDTTEIFMQFFPHATIYCFEPTPQRYGELKAKFQNDPRIKPYPYAITDTNGLHNFYEFSEHVTNSLLPLVHDSERFTDQKVVEKGCIQVPCMTLDKFCQENHVEKIDILKLDIQGGETRLLAGSKGILQDKKISLIFTEVTFVDLYESQGKYFEIAEILYKYGYHLFDYYNFAYDDKSGQLKWGDAIFVPYAKHYD